MFGLRRFLIVVIAALALAIAACDSDNGEEILEPMSAASPPESVNSPLTIG